jgi:hypothetical protein
VPFTRSAVFGCLADPRSYPSWLVGAQRIRHVDGGFPAPGAKFDHSVGPSPQLTVDDHSRSIAVEDDRRLVLYVRAGLFRGKVEFVLETRSDNATEIVMRERLLGPTAVVAPLLRPTLSARNRRSLQQLDDHLSRA